MIWSFIFIEQRSNYNCHGPHFLLRTYPAYGSEVWHSRVIQPSVPVLQPFWTEHLWDNPNDFPHWTLSVYARGLDIAEWEMEFTQNIQGTPPKTSNLKKHTPKWRRKIIFQTKLPFFWGVFSCRFPHSSLPFRGFQLTLGNIGGSPSMKWNRSKHTRYHETSFDYDFNYIKSNTHRSFLKLYDKHVQIYFQPYELLFFSKLSI